MHIAYIGLGKMGLNMVERLREKKHTVVAYDPNKESVERAKVLGVTTAASLAALIEATPAPRTAWLMVPHSAVEGVLDKLLPLLSPKDTVIEGGNSPYKETMRRARKLARKGIAMLDAGVSGGPGGARRGACIMVGGDVAVYEMYAPLFKDLSCKNGYAYIGESGMGHFVKMVHNGIEYGMMQAIAEGFDVLRASEYDLSLTEVARLYNNGSVVESRLMGWLLSGLEAYGEDLAGITGKAAASGEGLWTVETAHELDVPVKIIEGALKVREKTQKKPCFQGQVLSVMRNQFGGHSTT